MIKMPDYLTVLKYIAARYHLTLKIDAEVKSGIIYNKDPAVNGIPMQALIEIHQLPIITVDEIKIGMIDNNSRVGVMAKFTIIEA